MSNSISNFTGVIIGGIIGSALSALEVGFTARAYDIMTFKRGASYGFLLGPILLLNSKIPYTTDAVASLFVDYLNVRWPELVEMKGIDTTPTLNPSQIQTIIKISGYTNWVAAEVISALAVKYLLNKCHVPITTSQAMTLSFALAIERGLYNYFQSPAVS